MSLAVQASFNGTYLKPKAGIATKQILEPLLNDRTNSAYAAGDIQ